MKNEALCESLYQRGYQLYCQIFEQLNARLNYDLPVLDEDRYHALPLEQLTALAQQEDSGAQFCLGDYYASNGMMGKAVEWFQKSAGNRCAEAMSALGGIYLYGIEGVKKDRKMALEWLQKATVTGCSAFAVKLMCDYYLEQNEPSYQDYKDAIPWLMQYAIHMQNDQEENVSSALRVMAVLQLLITVDLESAYRDPRYADYQETENWALLCYYWQGIVQNLGATANTPGIIKTSEILCQIGECACGMHRDYGREVLKEAMEWGSDYAAVLLVPEAIDKAWNVRTTPTGLTLYTVIDFQVFTSNPIGPRQIKAANAIVAPYFQKVRNAATDRNYEGSYRQAEALYRLSHFYLFGLCCKRDHNLAHAYLEKATKLGHSGAERLLGRFRKKIFSGWEAR